MSLFRPGRHEAQSHALTAAEYGRIVSDKLSRAWEDLPGLAELLDYVRPGDTVVVTALDRLGRSLSGMIRTVETLTQAKVILQTLRENGESITELARSFGVSRATIYRARNAPDLTDTPAREPTDDRNASMTSENLPMPDGYPELLEDLKRTVATAPGGILSASSTPNWCACTGVSAARSWIASRPRRTARQSLTGSPTTCR